MTTPLEKKRVRVHDLSIAYVDRGAGRPIVFLHGNPTSSFLWRDVLGPLSGSARCIAPDLLGMGDSDKLPASGPGAYSFFDHRACLDGFLDALDLDDVTLVVHDWGSALGFDWARRHPERVGAIVYMEAIAGTMRWDEWPPGPRALFQRLRSSEGERLVLEQNAFVEQVLPASVLRRLEPAELDEYRRPFRAPGEGRRPTLSWPRQLPIDGEPPEVCEEVERYARWLAGAPVPKLFVNAEPGRILTGRLREACRRWPNQREVTVRGLHFLQEDSAPEIAAAIRAFLLELGRLP
ncbi:haloalkane dehalogenase [Anaeromyxobacter sp. PSR-1]|uniref:haloalkane dehalogenase n=1 Tax=unclassified Anaeromyxobacter TaxID=2620896 RepID=UPI0005E54AF6|nr:haloalkane dehalogenase [Anaeromyxobacter sp. PSR-1]GAO04179.1 haloalkane dehalogenase [Anaeromyxobacter sp. PSR-1]